MKMENEQYRKKAALIEHYRINYGINFTNNKTKKLFRELDDKGLELQLEKKKQQVIALRACIIIQKRFRGYFTKKWYQQVNFIRNNVARQFQLRWRICYKFTILPRRRLKAETAACYMIQRNFRRYMHEKKNLKIKRDKKINETFDYF